MENRPNNTNNNTNNFDSSMVWASPQTKRCLSKLPAKKPKETDKDFFHSILDPRPATPAPSLGPGPAGTLLGGLSSGHQAEAAEAGRQG